MNISRYTLGTGNLAVSMQRADRIIIRCSEDTRVSTDEGFLTYEYFTIAKGQTIVLDPPNYLNTALWFKLDSASSGVVEIWLSGVKI